MPATVLEKFLNKNDMVMSSPECDLKIGDIVTFTNENGVSFPNLIVIGFANPDYQLQDRFIHISSDCAWFPVKRSELTKQEMVESFVVNYSNGPSIVFKRHPLSM